MDIVLPAINNMKKLNIIDQQQNAEQKLLRQYHIFSNDYCFSQLFNDLPISIIVLNQNRQLVYSNKALLELMSLDSIDTILGKRVGKSLACVHDRDSALGCGTGEYCRHCELLKSFKSTGKNATTAEAFMRASQDTHEEAYNFKVGSKKFLKDGEVFILLSLVDISDEKRRLFLERIFLHDLSNTVSSLSMLSDMLDCQKRDPQENNEASRRINTLSKKMLAEIKAHKRLVAAEYNQLKLNFEKIDSLDFIMKTHAAFCNIQTEQEIKLCIDNSSESVIFETDQTLLDRILGNMIKNGLEASSEKETVTLGCHRKEDQICFWVHNNAYIARETQLKIFNRSFSTKGTGRGLGTYSMKYFTEKYLQGAISFQSDKINGTKFMVTYPLVQAT